MRHIETGSEAELESQPKKKLFPWRAVLVDRKGKAIEKTIAAEYPLETIARWANAPPLGLKFGTHIRILVKGPGDREYRALNRHERRRACALARKSAGSTNKGEGI